MTKHFPPDYRPFTASPARHAARGEADAIRALRMKSLPLLPLTEANEGNKGLRFERLCM